MIFFSKLDGNHSTCAEVLQQEFCRMVFHIHVYLKSVHHPTPHDKCNPQPPISQKTNTNHGLRLWTGFLHVVILVMIYRYL